MRALAAWVKLIVVLHGTGRCLAVTALQSLRALRVSLVAGGEGAAPAALPAMILPPPPAPSFAPACAGKKFRISMGLPVGAVLCVYMRRAWEISCSPR